MIRDLPFWHFFDALKRELRYSIDIDKYKAFVKMATESVSLLDNEESLGRFCKFLFLQQQRDEEKFERMFHEAVLRELRQVLTLSDISGGSADFVPTDASATSDSSASRRNVSKTENKPIADDDQGPDEVELKRDMPLYFQLPKVPIAVPSDSPKPDKVRINYLQTDEYFPLTRRNMVKAWQFLRYKDTQGFKDEIDVEATTRQIAKDYFFISPRYKVSIENRKDTLMIFADYRGSMAPFHELSSRLIQTAITEGGHPKASVWYFQNCPSGYVYRKSNLTQPVKLKEALATANRNFTLAIVISDGGSARGNKNPQLVNSRVKMTLPFLKSLDESCAHTIWLNPMPRHRWNGTCAEQILSKVYLMAPILEHDSYNFQDTLRTVLKQDNMSQI